MIYIKNKKNYIQRYSAFTMRLYKNILEKIMKKFLACLTIILATSFVASAIENDNVEKWYFGTGVSHANLFEDKSAESYVDFDKMDFDSFNDHSKITGNNPGFFGTIGYCFNKNLNAEFCYHKFGKVQMKYVDNDENTAVVVAKNQTASLCGIMKKELLKNFDVFGKLGIGWVKSKFIETDSYMFEGTDNSSVTTSAATIVYGLGVQYTLDIDLGFRLDYTSLKIPRKLENRTYIPDTLSFSVFYRLPIK